MSGTDDPGTRKAMDWFRNFLHVEHGLWFSQCLKRGERWYCYDDNNELVIILEDALVDRVYLALEKVEWLTPEPPVMDDGRNCYPAEGWVDGEDDVNE